MFMLESGELNLMINIDNLNKNQKEAVLSDSQFVRIIAGAGSGKTRVLVTRIAYLIHELGIFPYKILAITFTNKAANEMKDRIQTILSNNSISPWISTIHSLCVRILREDISTLNYPKNFPVMDVDDQKSVLKAAYKELGISAQDFTYGSMLDYISNNKIENVDFDEAIKIAGGYGKERKKALVYEYYIKRQKQMYALDFDDLLLYTVKLFKKDIDVLNKWRNRFHYIHVDEFQDIDNVQYEIIKKLTGDNNHLYVVGDPDQTIYTWRGADVNIIMNFEKDFSPCHTVILNENYRSNKNILNGANSVIKNNRNRVKKDLFTNKDSDEKITFYSATSEEDEASWIALRIREEYRKGKDYKNFAILYRSNYLSRAIDKGLLDGGIPYVIYGGIKFYDRAEIKDALCYLRMLSSGDDLAFERIINKPRRGIGNKSIETIFEKANSLNQTMYETIKTNKLLKGKTQKALDDFVLLVEKWKSLVGVLPIDELLEKIIKESGYKKMLEENKEVEKIENLMELVNDVRIFSFDNPESTLDEYLQMVSLYGDKDDDNKYDYVSLMTVHAAKGLEFDTVFVCGLSDGVFPSERSMADGRKGVEEERRIAYVAFTRAKNKLYLSSPGGFSYVLSKSRLPSRFITEIDDEYIENINEPKKEETINTFNFNTKRSLKKKSLNLEEKYKKGDKVMHDKFGMGIVLNCESGIVEIAFNHPHGIKALAQFHPSFKKM